MRSVTVLNSLTPIKEVPKTITISQLRKVWPLGQVTHRTVCSRGRWSSYKPFEAVKTHRLFNHLCTHTLVLLDHNPLTLTNTPTKHTHTHTPSTVIKKPLIYIGTVYIHTHTHLVQLLTPRCNRISYLPLALFAFFIP